MGALKRLVHVKRRNCAQVPLSALVQRRQPALRRGGTAAGPAGVGRPGLGACKRGRVEVATLYLSLVKVSDRCQSTLHRWRPAEASVSLLQLRHGGARQATTNKIYAITTISAPHAHSQIM